MSIRVLVVDDHPIVRQGIRLCLAGDSRLELVGEARDGEQALELCRRLCPDVAVIDLRLPGRDGLWVVGQLRKRHPHLRTILISGAVTDRVREQAAELGVTSVLHKEAEAHELCRALHACGKCRQPTAPPGSLTPREREVLGLIGAGSSNREIMNLLGIAEKTVKVHVTHILAKLELDSRVHAALYAVRHGICP